MTSFLISPFLFLDQKSMLKTQFYKLNISHIYYHFLCLYYVEIAWFLSAKSNDDLCQHQDDEFYKFITTITLSYFLAQRGKVSVMSNHVCLAFCCLLHCMFISNILLLIINLQIFTFDLCL